MAEANAAVPDEEVAAAEPIERLLVELGTGRDGLSTREAERRLLAHGPNELRRRRGHRHWRALRRQFTHPLALLLVVAAGLALLAGIPSIAMAVLVVVVLNASVAFLQEIQAERALDALGAYLPPMARVRRDGQLIELEASRLVLGDLVLIAEGDRVPADLRLLSGLVELDASTLTGESAPVSRRALLSAPPASPVAAADMALWSTTCTAGTAEGVVVATGMRTEIGRIAALSQRVEEPPSPLERQIRSVARLIAAIACALGLAFIPLAILAGGLDLKMATMLAIGLIAGNVPEGLLPVITLALALGARELARQGALVKRLSAIETLGSTEVICTDKTGTLTTNQLRLVRLWVPGTGLNGAPEPALHREVAEAIALCSTVVAGPSGPHGDPTELALLEGLGEPSTQGWTRRTLFAFEPQSRTMGSLDEATDGRILLHAKGAPESILEACRSLALPDGTRVPLAAAERRQVRAEVSSAASQGLRVLAVASRNAELGLDRVQALSQLTLLALVGLEDPPRPEAHEAVAACHRAGIAIHVITGDHPQTAVAVASEVGIGDRSVEAISGEQLAGMNEAELDALLASGRELVFARAEPEVKLRIADALEATGHTVAMTGDGVNDAPALRRADIGVAMGRSGTDVAREAATVVLTDDNFATIVSAVAAGRRIYDNIRRFIVYIFSHATPEVLPFLIYAVGRGRIPLPLTVLEILAVDCGTELLPALALAREPAEPDAMLRAPRPRRERLITRGMLARSWGRMGLTTTVLEMTAFTLWLLHAGWHPGSPVGPGQPLHHAYRQATTVCFLTLVTCQVGAAFAARTHRVSLASVGILSNPWLLAGIGAEALLVAGFIYLRPMHQLLGTASLPVWVPLTLLPSALLVWGVDELARFRARRRRPAPGG